MSSRVDADGERRPLLVQGNPNWQRHRTDDLEYTTNTPFGNDVDSPSSSDSSSPFIQPPSGRPVVSSINTRVRVNRSAARTRPLRESSSHPSDYPDSSGYGRSGTPQSPTGTPDKHRQGPHSNGGRQASYRQTSWQTRGALTAILVAVVLERICFYALTGNLVLFLNKRPFLWESYHAMNALLLFFGIAYIMSLVGGWIADAYLGRFRTLLLAYVIYVLGYAAMPLFAEDSLLPSNFSPSRNKSLPSNESHTNMPFVCGGKEVDSAGTTTDGNNPFTEACAWQVYLALIIIGIGSGMLKANLCPFGSDQLPKASQSTQLSFFNWYYWCINFGSFIGLGIFCFIQQQYSFLISFIICSGLLFTSALVFAIGRVFYTCRAPDGSVLTNVFKIFMEAFGRWRLRRKMRKQQERLRQAGAIYASRALGVESAGTSSASTDVTSSYGADDLKDGRDIQFLDYAKHQYGGKFHASLVDDVKKLGMITIVFAVMLPYWIVYFQMQTTFLFQALHMRLDFDLKPIRPEGIPLVPLSTATPGLSHAMIPLKNSTEPTNKPVIVAAWFSLFDALFVIILLPLFDRVIYPRLNRAGRPFTFSHRITLGMVCAMLAMVVAGVVEHFRLQAFWPDPDTPCKNASVTQFISGTSYEAADMSVFWQIPQYALIGMSEVFTSVACLQFAVSVSPKSMKALITGMFYGFCGVGSFLGTAILMGLANNNTWMYSHDYGNINCRLPCGTVHSTPKHECHLDYYFYSLAALEGLAIILFILVAWAYGLNTARLSINNMSQRPAASQLSPEEVERRRRQSHVQSTTSVSRSPEHALSM